MINSNNIKVEYKSDISITKQNELKIYTMKNKKKNTQRAEKANSIFKEYKDFKFQWHFDAETGELTFVSNQLNNK